MATSIIKQQNMKLDLLWTNPNPTQSFPVQTISVNLSNYKLILFEFKFTNEGTTKLSYVGMVGNRGIVFSSSEFNCYRAFSINANSVDFERCVRYTNYSTSANVTDNNYLIPNKIYGIN